MTGSAIAAYAPLDQAIVTAMANSSVPGASVAVTKDGRLVYARGYGYADTSTGALVQPDSLFRIASVSKVITSVAVLQLVDQGKLRLDDKFLNVMNIQLPGGADQRLNDVTIRMLLQYSGGWDSTVTGEWEFQTQQIAEAMSILAPPDPQTLFEFALRQPLQFAPGSKAVYGNVGHLVLGRIIERVSGQNYEDYVRQHLLAPMNIQAMRIGRTFATDRFPGEVNYYDVPGAASVASVFPGIGLVPAPYGGETIEGIDSFGGWVCSTIDLLRFWNGIEGRLGNAALSSSSLQNMTAQPSYAAGTASWWGLGVMVQDSGTSWWKSGSLPGTESNVVRFGSKWGAGFDWAVVFNGTPAQADLLPLWGLISGIVSQPTANPPGDLFLSFPSHDAGPAPTFARNAIVSSADFKSNVAPGSIFSIFGSNFAQAAIGAAATPLPRNLAGIGVTVNNNAAPLFFVNSTQLNAQFPFEVPPGLATVVMRNLATGVSSAPTPFYVAASAPVFFTDGQNNAIAQNQDSSLNTPSNGAIAGSVVTLYMTGQGPLDNPVPSGNPAAASPLSRASLPVTASIGGQNAPVLFSGLTPGTVGLLQLNLTVPMLSPGQYPVVVTIGSASSNPSNITIR